MPGNRRRPPSNSSAGDGSQSGGELALKHRFVKSLNSTIRAFRTSAGERAAVLLDWVEFQPSTALQRNRCGPGSDSPWRSDNHRRSLMDGRAGGSARAKAWWAVGGKPAIHGDQADWVACNLDHYVAMRALCPARARDGTKRLLRRCAELSSADGPRLSQEIEQHYWSLWEQETLLRTPAYI